MRQEAQRILDRHLPGRRRFHLTNAADMLRRDRIPLAQATNAGAIFGSIETNPASGNAEEEFIELLNPTDNAVYASAWELRGSVAFTFKPGTVLPGHGRLYLSPNVTAFRARQSGP